MAEHGFLRPNPVLFDLENRKKKPQLAHELGQGEKCSKCGDACPGFQLHYWRKVCQNCRCGKSEHNVIEAEDPGFYFVGKIFDRPLRSREEELEFCFGGETESSSSSSESDSEVKGTHGGVPSSNRKKQAIVKVEWAPPNISKTLARRYLQELPKESIPIAGTEAATHRKRQLEKQFPMHDIEPQRCHELTPGEVQSMKEYVDKVKEHVVGQGVVTEVQPGQDLPPPPSEEQLEQLERELQGRMRFEADVPPPLPAKPKNSIPHFTPTRGTVYQQDVTDPRNSNSQFNYNLNAPKPFGSTSSSANSSRNNSPSPTISISHHDQQKYSPQSSLHRPSQFVKHHGSGESPSFHSHDHKLSKNKNACMECHEILNPGDVAVKADRAGANKLWHPQCFKCFACQEILVDLLYYYDSGKIFCARDYATNANIPRCNACDELIFAAEYTGAENRAWHLKHFCCYRCDKPLAGHKYIPVDSQPHCLMCYQEHHGKICKTCGEYIDPEEQRVSLNSDHWHAKDECFCCGMCHVSLLGRKMTKKDKFILCSSSCSRKVSQMFLEGGQSIAT